ncbi:MAG TPA: cation-translocating P-type ATPase [Ktedonobacterales bacterium]
MADHSTASEQRSRMLNSTDAEPSPGAGRPTHPYMPVAEHETRAGQRHDDLGPEAEQEEQEEAEHAQALTWPEALRIVVVALAAAAVWFHVWEPFGAISVIGIAGLVIGGWPILKEAFENLLARRMTMELSMTIAIVAAAAIGQFFTALVITLFVLVAEVLEGLTVSRGRRAIRELLDVLPQTVTVRRDGAIVEVAADALVVGDAVLVNPGGRIPVDGTVLSGHSFVDQSRITGESLPAEKIAGAPVYAGSINQSGALELRADQIGRDTSFGKIIEAVERAEHSRAPVQRLADRLAAYLVYFALAAAAVTFLVTRDIRSTISVIIVAGACGIAAGTPLAVLGAIGRAARMGAVIKGGRFLEQLGAVDTVVLDKTGTLTFGEPEVQAILAASGVTDEEVLTVAAAAELRSEHPLGRTIVTFARERNCAVTEPDRFAYTPGRGVEATIAGEVALVGNRALLRDRGITISADLQGRLAEHAEGSEVYVARSGQVLGTLVVADTVRPEAYRAVEALHHMGIATLLLTGDTRAVASTVAWRLGMDEADVASDLMPAEKLTRVEHLVASGRSVAMLGDGVNDAPALTAAQVGVAMGSGTDVARESADVVLLGNDLGTFTATLALARRTRRIIWQNFAGTITVDLVGMGLAAAGLLNPLLAAFIHVTSELIFILNSARLLPPTARLRKRD